MISRSNRIRWNAIILDIIGLVFALLCGGFLLVAANAPQAQGVDKGVLLLIFGGQAVLWIIDLVMLMSPSAQDYCNQ